MPASETSGTAGARPARTQGRGPDDGGGRGGEESDESLMRRYVAGDRGAFDALFRRHAARVHGFFLRHGGGPARADDLLQTTWLHVHRARATWDPAARFTPWLYTIANNVRKDELRRGLRDRADLTREGQLPEPEAPRTLDEDEARRIRRAIQELPESQREVIVLHRYMDLSLQEIADALGTTEGAVKLRAHRGYLALRKSLGGVDGGQP